ncbi:MAG: transglutaminase family protein [Verrucomicrobiota bacterium]
MRYAIHHRTVYRYEDKVSYSHHLARLTPLETSSQNQTMSRIVVTPAPDILTSHRDYFDNPTSFFSLATPHQELVIDSHSEVIVSDILPPTLDLSPPWEEVRDQVRQSMMPFDLAAAEFCFPSPLCPILPELANYSRESFQPGTPVLEATTDLTRRIHEDFSFDSSATTVTTPVSEVFERKAGVCQDFAHLQISCLRSLGLPARYVSGYIRTNPPPGQPRLIGADASHAWVGLYVPQLGWTDFDATNNVIPTTHHIRVAHGRDYHDICPIRGTVYGGGAQTLEIGVTVTPMG